MEYAGMITSKDIISKTGISRATLNNYIKMGIIPRPIVGGPRPGQHNVKQIGYFPSDVMNHIFKVKLLKSQGMSMDEISSLFGKEKGGDVPSGVQETGKVDRVIKNEDTGDEVGRRRTDDELQVAICDIESPAYLVNRNFEIEWINAQAEDIVFNKNIRSLVDIESRNIFKLFLEQRIGGVFESWKDLAIVHFSVLQNYLNEDMFFDLYKGISDSESKLLVELYRERRMVTNGSRDSYFHFPVVVSTTGMPKKTYWVHTMTFREGTFIVFVPDDGINAELLSMLEHREKVINELLEKRMPSLVSLCVLVADLQDSVKISAELLPSQYFELINGLWGQVGPIFEKHNGIQGKHVSDSMLYYFVDEPGGNYIMDCIKCSIELIKIMKNISDQWKGIKGWDNTLFLNTGITEGQEFFGTIHSASTVEFTALGDTINIATRLSEFAHNGEIWTTKNLISKLSQEDRRSFRFGVQQRGLRYDSFIRDSFSRVSDLVLPESPHFHKLSSISGLPITEIKERVIPLTGLGC